MDSVEELRAAAEDPQAFFESLPAELQRKMALALVKKAAAGWLRSKGGDGGQKGLRDVAKRLGTQAFSRLRVGVGPPSGDVQGALDRYVLARFSAAERSELDAVLTRCCEVLRVYLHRGVDAAATCANAKRPQTNR